MTSPVSAQVQAAFADSDASAQPLIEAEVGTFSDGDRHLLLFPAVGASLAASAGSVRRGLAKTVDVPGGMLTFQGSETAQLPKLPAIENPTFEVLFAFDVN